IFENRRQYDRAVEFWKKANDTNRIQQIVGNWGQFETTATFPAGVDAEVQFRFRNGKSVHLKAQKVLVPQLLKDVQAYIRSNPNNLKWEDMNIGDIGHRLVTKDQKKYIGAEVATWDLAIKPSKKHFDKRITVTTPLKQAGAYLLTATMKDGNTSNIIIWINDTVIVQKHMRDKAYFFMADAVTGAPVQNMKIDFFGYNRQYINKKDNKGRRYNLTTASFEEATDQNGQCIVGSNQYKNSYQWLITARNAEGRFAYMGFSGIWYNSRDYDEYDRKKVFMITDRPVYRPAQSVKFKYWIRHARYDQEDVSAYANQDFGIIIKNPKGEKVFEKTFKTDEYGGLNSEFTLPSDATLGQYYAYVWQKGRSLGGGHFRVEEYKKPEFEVTVDAPSEPVMLGEKITATVTAKYYFGAPVTKAKAKYKILRYSHSKNWYPIGKWDWFYGRGYWWFASDYDWYPGWGLWGCVRPRGWWWPAPRNPPEVIADAALQLDDEGGAEIKIDTALAKAMHSDTDHRYEITVEVTDESRRTIVGNGSVLVARKPFKVYAWLDRGYYNVGDVVHANFSAQTLDNKPVKGKGVLNLYKIKYDKDGKPVENTVQQWNLDTDDKGVAAIQIKARMAGQYRFSYKLTDAKKHTIEGAYIFCIRGKGFDGKDFRFNEIELTPDQKEYANGDKAELMVSTDRKNSTVLLFVRATNGKYKMPSILRINGKNSITDIDITKKDMPNFFVEALTISDGRIYTEIREIIVPPEKRILNVEAIASAEKYLPGEEASVKVKVTDFLGKPFAGSMVLTVYDRALDYISGGTNVSDIKEFFWKWRRSHNVSTLSNVSRMFRNIALPKKPRMNNLGVFGHLIADQFGEDKSDSLKKEKSRGNRRMQAAAPMAGAMKSVSIDSATESTVGFTAMEDVVDSDQGATFGGGSASVTEAAPVIRKSFADTAYWNGNFMTDSNGLATVKFNMPDNLTGWSIKTWAMGHGTLVGEGSSEVATAKNLMLRMQAPRFFVETDEVVLSANIHNYLKTEKQVRAVLEFDGNCLEAIPLTAAAKHTDLTNKIVTIPAGGELRVDWRVKVLKEGEAVIRMKALTDEESDAMEMRFPVYVHGILKTESFSGVVRRKKRKSKLKINVPEERRINESRLEIRYSPSLAAAMVDALPYLADYPYGCTEQTLNRFLPAVLTQKILKDMGLDLSAIKDKRTNLNAQEIGDDIERAKQWKQWNSNPVFDEEELGAMLRAGVKRLANMQLADGGWGWFSGWGERSSPHTTAYVVHGLQTARRYGAGVDEAMITRGVAWLKNYQTKETTKLKNAPTKTEPWKERASHLDAFVYMVLADAKLHNKEMDAFLYRDRTHLAVYAKSMYGLALHQQKQIAKRDMLIRNIDQYLVEDKENQTAYLELQNGSYWWSWYGSEYEAQAYYLKLLAATAPKSDKAAGLVKYLLNNRKNSTYWNSTRDTAICIEAMADYLKASGEDKPDMTVEIYIDGKKRQEEHITAENLFTFNNKFVLTGADVTGGKHTIEVRRKGEGPVYFNAYLTYFSLEDFITKAGLEIKVDRKYYKLVKVDKKIKVSGAHGQALDQKVEKYERLPIANMDEITSGDLVEIELEIQSKNDYEYIIFEDMKVAGFEPVDVRSGYNGNSLGAYMELRDEKVCLFVQKLARGKHSVSYRMRAEIPGKFSALPTKAYAMYAPELRANSDEIKIEIKD
ncbi:MAG: alpha-2-macroglobulin, partial [Kiritimatiellae bacterium]|nr:alpha-2-macroglobulin [Kiritimatiellia bacterium]